MKKNVLHHIAAICYTVIICISCANADKNKNGDSTVNLSAEEMKQAKLEISARIVEIINGAKQLNADSALKPYADDPNFKIVNPDGSVMDYQQMKSAQKEAFSSLIAMEFSTIKEDFTFLAADLVICTWTGKNQFTLKSGEIMKTEPYVGSMVFKKRQNGWRIVYAHETSALPISNAPKIPM